MLFPLWRSSGSHEQIADRCPLILAGSRERPVCGPCRPGQWSGSLDRVSGLGLWTRSVVRVSGPGQWSGSLDRVSGPGLWTGSVERVSGPGLWSGSVDRVSGPDLWTGSCATPEFWRWIPQFGLSESRMNR
ncbi:hypothetical protein NHX12_013520 [Muraenolepis orangiensis]|uniref:Uncharacterized protein n=1 Tax=Muraenolepis orangiensis TaxID=630683 RepID=A0A9Q0DEI3_9TELE|nr:hypothetical protein NHX12_013520 [Muraenolepis orangiensis]